MLMIFDKAHRNKITTLIFKLTFIVFLTFQSTNTHAKEQNVLIVHSYHQGLEWTDSISEGIISVFKPYSEFTLHFDYLDTKRNNTDFYFQSIIDLYRSRSSKIEYKAIITSDNAAYDFMMEYHDEFFPNVPVFYCGVNFLDQAQLKTKNFFFGYEENANHEESLSMLKKLFPERKNILIINDYTLTGKKIRKELDKVTPKFEPDLNFEVMDVFSIDELKQKVSSLDNSYAIYLLVVNMDRLGNYISYNQGINIIQSNTNVPIIGSWDFYLGKGIVGGEIVRGKEQGEQISKLALNYLTKKDTLPPHYQRGITSPCLDYEQLKYFNLENHPLTNTALIINKPAGKAPNIKLLLAIIAVLTFFLIASIFILQIRRSQKNKLAHMVASKTRELQQANIELEKINKSKNEILGVVAHDLRSPIGNISGLSNYILNTDDERDKLTENGLKFLTLIEEASNFTLSLVSDLLNFSAIESGHLVLDRKKLEYIQFIQDIIDQNRSNAQKKGINLQLNSKLKSVEISYDQIKIQQVINNLIANAIRFSKTDSSIIISVESNREFIITSVTDSGGGVPQDKQQYIFEKFVSLKTDENIEHKGSGLGLSIAKGIIDAHHGKIYLNNNSKQGAKFTFELPI